MLIWSNSCRSSAQRRRWHANPPVIKSRCTVSLISFTFYLLNDSGRNKIRCDIEAVILNDNNNNYFWMIWFYCTVTCCCGLPRGNSPSNHRRTKTRDGGKQALIRCHRCFPSQTLFTALVLILVTSFFLLQTRATILETFLIPPSLFISILAFSSDFTSQWNVMLTTAELYFSCALWLMFTPPFLARAVKRKDHDVTTWATPAMMSPILSCN